VGTAVVFYLVILVIVYLIQPSMLYFPSRQLESTPEAIGLAFESVEFPTADGVTLHGWFIPAEGAVSTLLFCHGNAGNISHRLHLIELFHEMELSVFIFDYRGYGQSEGTTSESGTYKDAEGAWRYLTEARNISPEKIIILGRSLGGSIAAWLARRHQPQALILESAFTSIYDIAARHYPFLPVKLIARFKYNTREHIRQVHAPVLIIHSPDDGIVPFELGQKLFDAANQPKDLLKIAGGHNEGYAVSGKLYIDGITGFLDSRLGPLEWRARKKAPGNQE